jgi:TP901 family phage tail tape measure protein
MKTIEAQLVISAQDKTGAALSKLSKEIDGAVKSVDRFRAAQSKFAESRTNFRAAQQAVEGAARAMKAAATPTRELEAAYRRAQIAVSGASAAFNAQKSALIGAKRELEGYGVAVSRLAGEEHRLQAVSSATGVAAERQAARAARRQRYGAAASTVGSVAGLYVAHEAARAGHASLETYREFDKERRFQKAVMGLSDEEQKPLVEQAIRGGASTKYNDIQWLEAQRELAARGLKKDQILGMTPTAANLGQALDLSLPDAVKQLEGAMFGFKKDMSTLAAVQASAIRTADLQTKAAKISGMTPEDIKEVYKFGATPARMSGVSEELLLAFGGISKKANMGGDESGVAFRALMAAANAPTAKAKTAMLANGLDYKNYQNSPDQIALKPFVADVAAKYGVKLDEGSQAGLGKIFGDKQLLSDPALFAPAVMKFLKSSLGGNDAKSLKSIAGEANRYRDASMKNPDVNKFIVDLMSKMANNIPFANAVFGSKQGGRIATALGDPETFRHMIDELTNHSAGFSQKIADERMAGFDGAVSRLEGSLKNVETAIGRSWDSDGKGGALTALTDVAGKLAQSFTELNTTTIQILTGMAAVVSASAGIASAFGLATKFFGAPALAGPAAAATGLIGVPAVLGAAANDTVWNNPKAFAPVAGGGMLGAMAPEGYFEAAALANAGSKPDEAPAVTDAQSKASSVGRAVPPWVAKGIPDFNAGDAAAVISSKPTAEVKGSADLNVAVQVEPSDSFISRIVQAIRNEINVFGSGASPGAGVGTAGSTGLSMPEAGPQP